jgi:two-component system, OmpR family, phosphate regulon response regulator OmpR
MSLADAVGAHILVVDDDRRIRALLSRFLLGEGYFVTAAATTAEAETRMRDFLFDLIVLDVMMPGENGVAFVRRLRGGGAPQRAAPILMLTARGDARDRVEGLEAGVDDYLAKPFEPRELVLRIASILRRTRRVEQAAVALFGEFSFDLATEELACGDRTVHLTTRERDLLRALALAGAEGVARSDLARRDAGEDAGERSVDVEIARLRRKIEADPAAPRYLQTMRGRGYRLLQRAEPKNEDNGVIK